MILSVVVFVFGLVICGIVALGVLNAQEVAHHIAQHQAALARQQVEWEVVSEKATQRQPRPGKRAA